MDELEDAKEEHIDLEFFHRLRVAAMDELYENAMRTDVGAQLVLRTLKSAGGGAARRPSEKVD